MKRLNLAPHVSVKYWRATQAGLMRAWQESPAPAAEFAILQVLDGRPGPTISYRFELPRDAGALEIALAAAEAAYALGHHDRRNRMRALLGLDPISVVLTCERTSDDA
jgi:hypothetical protein